MSGLFFAAGSADYEHGELCELGGVAGDLERVQELFTRTLGYGGAPALLNESAGTLRSTLGGDPDTCFYADDTVVVYYTGHGDDMNGRHYLLCVDSDPDRPAATALSTEDLVRLMHERGARRLLLIIDTCCAAIGGAESVSEAARSVALELGQRPQLYVGRGLTAFSVISAARDYERAVDCRFSQALVQAVSSEACGGTRAERLLLEDVVDHINRALGESGTSQHATHATLLSDPEGHPFFPNPRHTDDPPPEDISLAEQRAWVMSRRDAERPETKASAPEAPVGRARDLARLETWSDAEAAPRRWLPITGSPGSGKSTLLRALAQRLAWRAGTQPVPPAAHLLVDLRHRHVEDLVSAIAVSEGAPPDTPPEQLEAGLRTRVTPFVLLVDGVEEAGGPGDANEPARVARFLSGLAARVGQTRVIATWHPARDGAPRSPAGVDLDRTAEDDENALVDLTTRLLLAPDGPGSDSGWTPEQAREAAPGVVSRAGGNRLVLRLEVLRLTTPGARPLPEGSDGSLSVPEAFRRALRARCPDLGVHALLTGLAFAHGTGLPWAGGLWQDTVSRMYGLALTDDDVRKVLECAAPFVTEGVDSAGRSVYRLHHEAYAEALRTEALEAQPDSAERMLEALEEEAGKREERARREPGRFTDPYLVEHLPRHRTAGRRPPAPDLSAPDLSAPEPAQHAPGELAQLLHHLLMRQIHGLGEMMPTLRELLRTSILITTSKTPSIESVQDTQGHKRVTVRAAPGESLHVTEF
jgi:hypothetical protein